jgi:hypothetical protein
MSKIGVVKKIGLGLFLPDIIFLGPQKFPGKN